MYVVNIVIIYYDTVVKVFTMQTTFVKMIFSMYGTLKFYMHQFKEHLLNLYRYYTVSCLAMKTTPLMNSLQYMYLIQYRYVYYIYYDNGLHIIYWLDFQLQNKANIFTSFVL